MSPSEIGTEGELPEMQNGWLWLSTPKATIALEVTNGIVTHGPPYARRWALGKTVREIVNRYRYSRNAKTVWFERPS